MTAIEVKDLIKSFNGFIAVDHISFCVEGGELFALLGPNGAGKTTTIKILTTLLNPTSGFARVSGFDVRKNQDAVRENIGIVFQEPALDRRLTGRENLDFHARMYGMRRKEREARIEEVLKLVELEDKADIVVNKYSGGMERRLEIARGFIHKPKVLFLDEPTSGLDVQTRRRIWEYIKEMNKKEGVTMVLTTHYMEEADYLCERVGIMDRGKIIALDTPWNLKNLIGSDLVTLETKGKGNVDVLKNMDFVKSFTKHEDFVVLSMEKGEERIVDIIEKSHQAGIEIKSVALRKPSLEDVFLLFTGRTIREEETKVGRGKALERKMWMRRWKK